MNNTDTNNTEAPSSSTTPSPSMIEIITNISLSPTITPTTPTPITLDNTTTNTPTVLTTTATPSPSPTSTNQSLSISPAPTNHDTDTDTNTDTPTVTVTSTITPTIITTPPSSISTNDPSSTPSSSLSPSNFNLITLLSSVALYNGTEFLDYNSYQSKAFTWLQTSISSPASQNSTSIIYTHDKLIARYAMACIYYSTNAVSNALTTDDTRQLYSWANDQGWMEPAIDECDWFGITCDDGGKIIQFNMNGNNLTGVFPPEITLISDTLISLELQFNDFVNKDDQGVAFLGQLTNLKYLDIGATNFIYDGIPTALGRLTNLEALDISYTLMWGPLRGPEVWANLQKLNYLELGGNSYNESIPDELATLPLLTNLYVENALLEGTLDFIVKMPSIFELWIDSNPGLKGTIPTEIGLVTTLESLSVTFGALTGTLPSELGLLVGMQGMWFYGNSITGTMPRELGSLSNMVEFQTESNDMTGNVPAEVCALLITAALSQLSTDCSSDPPKIDCVCCTCCGYPCP
eukprot:CAMPEP_0202452324 /NCGR_PEP_ID=MMETSP1360-20130828/10559_1 /ASSEMBLY_ACC=CAM_ASM_000848 /TAXON_ID=515479 /ORGANISM="Licmophora paradoxa, Strain CCMP2313" /LENGTH=519 /DNA_ID=CAMNT_0049071111 /DNA_START=141 /DNA_END=1700 /DNA_ORIENTATION=+